MQESFSMEPAQLQMLATVEQLRACNDISAHFGLALTQAQAQTLAQRRFDALQNTGRIEFGEGVLKKLVYAFCDSPFIAPQTYSSTLTELQDLFYFFKNDCHDSLSDDELISCLKAVFNGRAQGALDFIVGLSVEDLCRHAQEPRAENASVPDDQL